MALLVTTAPHISIKEIDKSGYTPSMAGTAVYLKGFTGKGEAYKCMEITTRSAFEQIYGAPDTEAERYTYAAACETLNQGGRLYVARLPYDNASFEKMVGIKYSVEFGDRLSTLGDLSDVQTYTSSLVEADSELNEVAIVRGGRTPMLYDLSAIDEFRTDEAKVPANTFLIVDTTGATYGRVVEDERRGMKRECIGIIPVVTTAANALYAQNYITVKELSDVNKFESLNGEKFNSLVATNPDGTVLSIDGLDMQTSGLLSNDLVQLIASNAWFTNVETLSVNVLSTDEEIQGKIIDALKENYDPSSDNKFNGNKQDKILQRKKCFW